MSHKKFDITLKDLVEQYAFAWAQLAGQRTLKSAAAIDADISTLSAEADKVLRVQSEGHDPWLLNLELQASHMLGLPDTVHYKSVALRRRHGLLVHSLIVLLRREAVARDLTGTLTLQLHDEPQPYTVFRYQVLRLWEFPLSSCLSGNAGLLPLAPLTDDASTRLPEVLAKIDERVRQEVSLEEAEKLRVATFLLMGLRYQAQDVQQLIQGVMHMTLESSSTYQWIIDKGKEQGRAEGKEQGLAEGSLNEARAILLRLGTKKFGYPEPEIIAAINAITDLEKLESLTERLLLVKDWKTLLD